MKKYIGKYLILSLLLWGAMAHGQSLNAYLQEGAENNPGLKAAFQQYQYALQQVPQVKALPDPQLEMGYFIVPVETRVGPQQARLGLMQMFPWFGTRSAREEVASQEAEVAFHRFLALRNAYVYELTSVWGEMYQLDQQLALLEQDKVLLSSLEALALSSYQANRGSMADVLRSQMKLRERQADLDTWQDRLIPLQTRFNNLLGREESLEILAPSDLDLPRTLPSFDVFMDSVLEGNPLLAVLAAEQQSIQASQALVSKQSGPQFGLGINYMVTGKRTDIDVPNNGKDAIMPMVSMSLPIWGKKYRAQRESQDIRLQVNHYQRISQQNELENVLQEAWVSYREAERRVTLYQDQARQAQDILDLLITSYSSSGKEFEEVLELQQEVLNYQQKTLAAKRDQYLAWARLQQLQGK